VDSECDPTNITKAKKEAQNMTSRKLNRRDFIGGLSQSVLSLLVLSRATQQFNDGYPPMMWTDSALESIFAIRDHQGKVQSLVCWVNGDNAKKLDAMSSRGLEQFVRSQLKLIRPGIEENMEIVRVVSWGRDPFARGAYSYFGPGQIRRFQHLMAKPWQRIYFAGEHTAISSPGMESALESAERVAQEILTRV
jgi:monoamine oxidase